jgi:hypothetical protein
MRRSILACALGVAVLLLGLSAGPAWAGKSGGSSGFSSGGRGFSSPSGRSYSSGGGGPSFAPSGKSYGSGSGGRSFTPSGKSYSPGGSSTPSVPPMAGGRTYSAPSTPSPAAPSPGGKTAPISPPIPSGKSYGAGRGSTPAWPTPAPREYGSPSGKSYQPPSTRTRPSGFDSAAAAAQQKEASRAQFAKGKAPEPTYTDPKGTVRPIDPKDRRIEELRGQLDHTQWANRQLREQQYYRDYYTRPVVFYHDPYSSPFWWWLLDQNLETRSLWVYNHQMAMDQARYQALLQNAQLAERVRQLEAQNAARNPAYVPPGLPPDLMYTDAYVNAAYNPQPAAPPPVVYVPRPAPAVHFWHGVRVLLFALVVLAILALIIWLVFFKRWGGAPR